MLRRAARAERRVQALAAASAGVLALALAGCSTSDEPQPSKPTPPSLATVSAAIHERNGRTSIRLSPSHQTIGRVQVLAANLTARDYSLILTGTSAAGRTIRTQSDQAIPPSSTGKVIVDLPAGVYEVRAGWKRAARREATPATLTIVGTRHEPSTTRP